MIDIDWQFFSFDPPKPVAQPVEAKGCCPKCGKHIGKGIHFHVKACDGHSGKAG